MVACAPHGLADWRVVEIQAELRAADQATEVGRHLKVMLPAGASMNGPATSAVEDMKRLLSDGIYTDIYLALEAHSIFKAIGERVPSAEASTYQPMLAALQFYSTAEFVLAVTRLLERQTAKYELHSVHGVLMFLRDKAAAIPVKEPIFIQQSMERLGMWDSVPHDSGVEQTRAVADALISKLPHHTNNESLKALKDLRNKRIAHPEKANPEALQTTSWNEALKLLQIPVEALAVGGAYTSMAYVDNKGRFRMEGDAARAGVATRKLLEPPPTR